MRTMNRPLKPGMRDREILIKSTLLSQLGMESTAAMMEMAAILSLAPHQVLFRAGEAADSLYCVLIGYVRAYHLEAGGREADVALYGPGEFIGAGAVFDNKGHTVNAHKPRSRRSSRASTSGACATPPSGSPISQWHWPARWRVNSTMRC